MAASIRLDNNYLLSFIYECQQMTDKFATAVFPARKNQAYQLKSYRNYQIVSSKEN